MDKRWKQSLDDEIDARIERFTTSRLQSNRHFTKREAIAAVLQRPLVTQDSDPKLIRVLVESYAAARVSRRLHRRTKHGRREIEGYSVPGEGYRYRAARLMRASEFQLVTREYVERAEASRVKADFMLEVTAEAEQMGLFDADDFITVAYDRVVDRYGDDPLLAVAA